ncbi:FAD-dependent oxidoreductase [Haloprofundus sp. MHR1]|uniref:FAD-dependent oxidoreductase n=1 Tax=Haloprofundus sp. MHR1 TaxID=2572921 RepID=UPI0010BE89B6|nr:FAD-dependent oxidoreductase [Haloprofundus sp. MHR1]QCJ47790.1 FAD-binding protein [Haloprofundus sp. MHR1]
MSDTSQTEAPVSNDAADYDRHDVLVVGGGVAGLSAATFTARAGLDTVVVDDGNSIVKRNAHLENVPGFPAGVNPRLFCEMQREQARRSGSAFVDGRVTDLRRVDGGGFRAGVDGDVDTDSGLYATYVVAASWSDTSYLDGLGVDLRVAGSKTYIGDDGLGRTSVEGLYAAGRLTERYHQAVVAAGHGAQTAITLVHDSETPFYNDWVTPKGYFTDRGREVPPGCEEIDEAERRRREAESLETMQASFAESHPEPQRTHPSLVDDE